MATSLLYSSRFILFQVPEDNYFLSMLVPHSTRTFAFSKGTFWPLLLNVEDEQATRRGHQRRRPPLSSLLPERHLQ